MFLFVVVNGLHEFHGFIFFLCHQMKPINRMAGAMYCLVHLVCLVMIKTTYSTKDNLCNQCNLLTKEKLRVVRAIRWQ